MVFKAEFLLLEKYFLVLICNIQATVPIQQYISLQVSENLKNVSNSAYLSSPLYVLFYQFSVFKETSGSTLLPIVNVCR